MASAAIQLDASGCALVLLATPSMAQTPSTTPMCEAERVAASFATDETKSRHSRCDLAGLCLISKLSVSNLILNSEIQQAQFAAFGYETRGLHSTKSR